MDIVYIILWAVLGVYCYVIAHKISPILYLAGVFFTFMFGWYLADYLLTNIQLTEGTYGIIFKVIAIVFLAIIILLFYKQKKSQEQ